MRFVHILLPVGKPSAPPGRAVVVLLAFGGSFQECFFLPRGPGSIIFCLPNEENLAHRLSIAFLEEQLLFRQILLDCAEVGCWIHVPIECLAETTSASFRILSVATEPALLIGYENAGQAAEA